MKKLLTLILLLASVYISAQQTKSKNLMIKYNLPPGWNAAEFGGKIPWENKGNTLCDCSGILFSRSHPDGKMNVLLYPSTVQGLDSAKRSYVGNLKFEDVQKYDKTRNKNFSFELKPQLDSRSL
jgi:hypothetical protein